MEAHHALGVTLSDLGEFSSALEHLEQAISIHKRHYHDFGAFKYGQDAGVVCGSQAAWVLWLLGRPEKALKKNQETLSLARRLSHPYSLVVALNLAALLHQHLRDSRASPGTGRGRNCTLNGARLSVLDSDGHDPTGLDDD